MLELARANLARVVNKSFPFISSSNIPDIKLHTCSNFQKYHLQQVFMLASYAKIATS